MNCHPFWTWEQLSEEHLTGEGGWQVAEGPVEGPGEKADRAGAPLQETCSAQDPGVTCFPLETGVEQSRAWKALHLRLHVPLRLPAWVPRQPRPSSAGPHTPFQLLCTPKRPGLDTELGMQRELGTRLPWCEQWKRHLALPWGTPAFRGWSCVCSRGLPSHGPCRSQRDDKEASGRAGTGSGKEHFLHVPQVSFLSAQAHSF